MKARPLRLVVSGCCGRMGTLLSEEAGRCPEDFELHGGTEHAGHPQVGQPWKETRDRIVAGDLKAVLDGADLLLEFTTPEATVRHAQTAADHKVPMLIGTTGLTADQFDTLQQSAKQIPIFWSPNMSTGMVIVRRLIAEISESLFRFGVAAKTKVQISEVHHAQKKDKPSGTAKALAQALLAATGWLIRDEEIEARREGDAIGTHAVTFRLPSETITLAHEATDRRVFAQGALLVAKNFHRLFQRPGWYGMDDFVTAHQKPPSQP